jgi:hypothetical protein
MNMNIYTFYYKALLELPFMLPCEKTGQEKFMATNPNNAYFKFINWAEDNGLYILDYDTEIMEVEQ